MSVLDVLMYPHPALREKTERIETFDASLKTFVDDMFETMKSYNGIGLASPQVGVLQKLFVVWYDDQQFTFINPVLSKLQGTQSMNEGCLSLPEILVPVDRAYSLHIHAQDRNGKPFHMEAEEMLATIIQHEHDHLEGILIIDKNPPIPA